MKHRLAALAAFAGLVLAQLAPPGSSNLGVPSVPGTRVPESNPATAVVPPPAYSSGPSAPSPAAVPLAPVPSGDSGPAYSFGAAPRPIISPGR